MRYMALIYRDYSARVPGSPEDQEMWHAYEACAAYRDALALITNSAEQRFLETRLVELAEPR